MRNIFLKIRKIREWEKFKYIRRRPRLKNLRKYAFILKTQKAPKIEALRLGDDTTPTMC